MPLLYFYLKDPALYQHVMDEDKSHDTTAWDTAPGDLKGLPIQEIKDMGSDSEEENMDTITHEVHTYLYSARWTMPFCLDPVFKNSCNTKTINATVIL